MPTVPIEIIHANASAGGRYGLVSGRIDGRLRGGLNLTAEACHGLALGIEPGVTAAAGARGQALFIGAAVDGSLTAQAGAKVMLRLEPNPFETLGLTLEAGAYAFAAAAARLGVYITPEYFAAFIQDQLEALPADLFLIFLEEVRAEVGVWGKIAAAAAIEGHATALLKLDGEDSGFEISGGFSAGWGVGTGWDFYCTAGFANLRRAVKRSCLRIDLELLREIRRQPTPGALGLARAFDFTFPLVVMTAYDLGVIANRKRALLSGEDVAIVVLENFSENLQRFTTETLAECALKWLADEFGKLYITLGGRTFSQADSALLEQRIGDLLEVVDSGEFNLDKLDRLLSAATDIVAVLDDGELTRVGRPLTAFWLASMLGLRSRQLLDAAFADAGIGSSFAGNLSGSVSLDLLPDPPQLLLDEINATLQRQVLSVDVGVAVDYLIAIGVRPMLSRYSPAFSEFRGRLEAAFGLSAGDIAADVMRSIAGVGSLSQLNSYTALKQFIQQELHAARGQLLPLVKQQAAGRGDTVLVDYLDEVVDPCIAVFSSFLFAKLDDLQIANLNPSGAARRQLVDGITAGCGVVVYQVLVRNLIFFDRIVTDFMLDNTRQGFRDLRVLFEEPDHPFMQACRQLLEQNLPGHPDLSGRATAIRTLLLDLASAFEEMYGPAILTPARRSRIHALKRDILLSMGRATGNTGNPSALAALIDHILDCLHIPNLDQARELSTLMLRIQAESFAVMMARVGPALSDFYLAITLQDLAELRQQLSSWIRSLRRTAEDLIAEYAELAAYIRSEITEALEQLERQIGQLRADIQAHLQGDWAGRAKAAVRNRVEVVVTTGLAPGAAREAALNLFAVSEWLIIGPLLDAAATSLAATVTPLLGILDDLVENSSNALQGFLNWWAGVEAKLLKDLEHMLIIPAAEAAEIILDTLIPPYLLRAIEDYLAARAKQKALERERVEQMQLLAQRETARDSALGRYHSHDYQPDLVLHILMPTPEADRVYAASLRISVFAAGLSDEVLADPRSRRVQFRLNARALPEGQAQWSATSAGHIWSWHSLTPQDFATGLNLFEVSWIRGAGSTQVERRTVQFMVDPAMFYPEQDIRITVDADPPGPDVDAESVLIEWFGSAPLELDGWMIRDQARHRYSIPPGVSLVSGQRLRVFTGRNPHEDDITPTAPEKTLHMGRRAAIWNNTGDLCELVHPNGVTAASKAYGNYLRGGV